MAVLSGCWKAKSGITEVGVPLLFLTSFAFPSSEDSRVLSSLLAGWTEKVFEKCSTQSVLSPGPSAPVASTSSTYPQLDICDKVPKPRTVR